MPPNRTPPSGEKLNHFLLEKIWRNDCLLDALCDPKLFETYAAVGIAQQMMERYRNLDTRLVNELVALPDVSASKDLRIERCLEILDAVSPGRRIIMPLMQLMNSENQRVRSKVARILGRRVDNLAWTRKFLGEVDDRTRANIIESLWGNDSAGIREVLWQAVQDSNNRVQGNAILALYRLGVAGVLPAIRAMAESETTSCRATAAWVMGATGDPRFREFVKTLRQDAEARVRAAALGALVQLNKPAGAEGQPNPEPSIWFCEDLEGVRRVGFDLLGADSPPQGLLPTDVVLTENGNLVWGYTFAERRSIPLSALFLIFDGLEPEALAGLGDVFVECLDHKDTNDRWSVLRMVTGSEGDFEVLRMVVPPSDGPPLEKIVRFDKLLRVKTQELSKTARLLGTHGPGRHLVLLLTASALSDADLESLELAALALHLSVDVISFSHTGNEQLQRIARQTEGLFIIAPGTAISPEWMLQTYAAMAHRYEITFPSPASGDAPFEIKIVRPRPKGARSGPIRNQLAQ